MIVPAALPCDPGSGKRRACPLLRAATAVCIAFAAAPEVANRLVVTNASGTSTASLRSFTTPGGA